MFVSCSLLDEHKFEFVLERLLDGRFLRDDLIEEFELELALDNVIERMMPALNKTIEQDK